MSITLGSLEDAAAPALEDHRKLCINCKHIATNPERESARFRCLSPKNTYLVNLVDGKKEYINAFCGTQRLHPCPDPNTYPQRCGIEGNWYEYNEKIAGTSPRPAYLGYLTTAEPTVSKRLPKTSISADDL